MSFASEAVRQGQASLETAQRTHALTQARRYIRFCRVANSTEGARYSMAEYLKLQGVRADLIPSICRTAEEKYGA